MVIINLGVAAVAMAATPASGPSLQLGSREVDLGFVAVDSVSHGDVWVYNKGDEPLVITQVFTDCGCTATEYAKDLIAPGDSAILKVSFNSRGRSPGSFRKAVRIRSNARNRTQILFVKGRVKRPVRK